IEPLATTWGGCTGGGGALSGPVTTGSGGTIAHAPKPRTPQTTNARITDSAWRNLSATCLQNPLPRIKNTPYISFIALTARYYELTFIKFCIAICAIAVSNGPTSDLRFERICYSSRKPAVQ